MKLANGLLHPSLPFSTILGLTAAIRGGQSNHRGRDTENAQTASWAFSARDNVNTQPTHPLPDIAPRVFCTRLADVPLQEAFEMETITIPSPSAFLNSPVIKALPKPPPTPKRKSTTTPKPAKKIQKLSGADKPKQSKSRNGMQWEFLAV